MKYPKILPIKETKMTRYESPCGRVFDTREEAEVNQIFTELDALPLVVVERR